MQKFLRALLKIQFCHEAARIFYPHILRGGVIVVAVFFCCVLHRNPTGPNILIPLSSRLSIAAMHEDSVSVRVVAGGDGPAGRFILPFIYADNPVDSLTGPLVTSLVITDKQ